MKSKTSNGGLLRKLEPKNPTKLQTLSKKALQSKQKPMYMKKSLGKTESVDVHEFSSPSNQTDLFCLPDLVSDGSQRDTSK